MCLILGLMYEDREERHMQMNLMEVKIFCEPPYADPHVRWCGGWGRKPPGYPIYARLLNGLDRVTVINNQVFYAIISIDCD